MLGAPDRRTGPVLDSLDRRIVAALHVDGRATWRRIASVLNEAERTVTRRGTQLLASGAVAVHALADPHRIANSEPFIVLATCNPGAVWTAAVGLARRPESVVTHILTGSADCVVDIWCPQSQLSTLLLHEIGGIGGLSRTSVAPILRYIKTVHNWQPGILTEDEIAQLQEIPELGPWPSFSDSPQLSRADRLLLKALTEDGRSTYEELGRISGTSEQTARRRVDALRRSGLLVIRALVDPRLIGLPIGALLRIKTAPTAVENVADALLHSPAVRYAAHLMGEYQLLADVRFPSKSALTEFLVASPWLKHVDAMESSLIIATLKQSGQLTAELR
jgi:DNA-binding Lrp family transcriptional regulator